MITVVFKSVAARHYSYSSKNSEQHKCMQQNHLINRFLQHIFTYSLNNYSGNSHALQYSFLTYS
jgi:hypothetical protein